MSDSLTVSHRPECELEAIIVVVMWMFPSDHKQYLLQQDFYIWNFIICPKKKEAKNIQKFILLSVCWSCLDKHLYLVSLSTWVRWPLSLSSQDQNCLNSLNSKKGASRFIMSFSREDKVLIVCYYFNWSVSFIYLYFILTYLILCLALLSEVKVPHK